MGGEHDQVGQLGRGELGLDDQQVHDLSDPVHGLGLAEVTLRQLHPEDDQGSGVSRAGGTSGSDCSAEVRRLANGAYLESRSIMQKRGLE